MTVATPHGNRQRPKLPATSASSASPNNRADQAAEAENKTAWSTGARARPAAEWRWLRDGHVNVNPGAPRGTLHEPSTAPAAA